ncbi:hypothetical protein R3P38DRAFT_578020, partial [Favolaschia claudopus]
VAFLHHLQFSSLPHPNVDDASLASNSPINPPRLPASAPPRQRSPKSALCCRRLGLGLDGAPHASQRFLPSLGRLWLRDTQQTEGYCSVSYHLSSDRFRLAFHVVGLSSPMPSPITIHDVELAGFEDPTRHPSRHCIAASVQLLLLRYVQCSPPPPGSVCNPLELEAATPTSLLSDIRVLTLYIPLTLSFPLSLTLVPPPTTPLLRRRRILRHLVPLSATLTLSASGRRRRTQEDCRCRRRRWEEEFHAHRYAATRLCLVMQRP